MMNFTNCTSSLECLAGSCVNAICVCTTGYTGAFCERSLTVGFETHWLLVRTLSGVAQGIVFILAISFVIHYWVKNIVPFPRITREISALIFVAIAALLSLLNQAIDPFRLSQVLAGMKIDPGYNGGLQLLPNLCLSFIGISYAALLAYWITIRGTRTTSKGWTTPAKVVFTILTVTFIVTALAASFIEAYIYENIRLFFFAYLAICALGVGAYIIHGGATTLKDLGKFKKMNASYEASMRRISVQLIFTGCAIILSILALVVAAIINADDPIRFIWVRNFLQLSVQVFVEAVILHIFRYSDWKKRLAKKGSSASGTNMGSANSGTTGTTRGVSQATNMDSSSDEERGVALDNMSGESAKSKEKESRDSSSGVDEYL